MVFHLSCGNPLCQYKLEDEQIENNPAEKDLEVLVDNKLDMRQKCILTALKATHTLDSPKRSVSSK